MREAKLWEESRDFDTNNFVNTHKVDKLIILQWQFIPPTKVSHPILMNIFAEDSSSIFQPILVWSWSPGPPTKFSPPLFAKISPPVEVCLNLFAEVCPAEVITLYFMCQSSNEQSRRVWLYFMWFLYSKYFKVKKTLKNAKL